jgi:hypothetical protein
MYQRPRSNLHLVSSFGKFSSDNLGEENAVAGMSDHHGEEQEDAPLSSFMRYVQTQGVMVHPSVRPYQFHGHGLGIRATGVIEVCNRFAYCIT